MFGIIRADRDDDAAGPRAFEAEIDVLKRRALAGALVVDDEAAVLEAELAQIVAVEPGLADAVEPGQQRGDTVGRRRAAAVLGAVSARRRRRPDGGAGSSAPERAGAGGSRHLGGGDRMLVGAGERS